jgi:hypothetical protein
MAVRSTHSAESARCHVATLVSTTKAGDVAALRSNAEVGARWINSSFIAIVSGGVAMLMVAARLYQQKYAWSTGLDATAPEFQTYWMNLLFGQFAVEAMAAAGIWGYVWFSRPKDLVSCLVNIYSAAARC